MTEPTTIPHEITDTPTPEPVVPAETGDVGQQPSEEGAGATDSFRRRFRRAVAWCGRHWLGVAVVTLLIASAAGAGAVYSIWYRPDQQTDAAVRSHVLDAASDGAVSVLSYGPDTFDADLATAKTHLTGAFLTYYSEFADKFVAPAVKQKRIVTSATVVGGGVIEQSPDSATVLLFVNQQTNSQEHPDQTLANSSILVTLEKAQTGWLISEFNPV